MKPLNLDNRPCSPISSNCVIWQGPDIPCIKLCAGDTVSDIVAKLGTELCTILDQLNVSTYDLSCLNLSGCAPSDFHGLIQLLITKICEANGVTGPTTKSATAASGCPDCVVSVAPCLVQNGQTTMQLVDYVQLAANKVCSILDQITVINNQIASLDNRVTVLENTPPPTFTLPSIEVDCTLADSIIVGGNIYPIDQVLNALVNDDVHGYCALLTATGQPASLLSAVATQCISSTDPSLANPGNNMGTAYFGSWVNTPLSAADAITNLWLSLCDIYTYLTTSLPAVDVVGSTWVDVTSSTVGNVTTYTVSEIEKPGLSVYLSPPDNLNKTTPALNTGRLCDGSIQVMTSIDYNDFGPAYNPATGIFTVPTTGVYEIGFFSHFTRDAADGWFDAGVPGMFTAGIVSPTGCNFYCVNSSTPVVAMKHCSINGSITRPLTAGVQICLKVINLTNFNYTTYADDIVRLTIQRVK